MEQLNEPSDYSWNYPKQKIAEAILKLAASFDGAHDVEWGQEVDEEVEPE